MTMVINSSTPVISLNNGLSVWKTCKRITGTASPTKKRSAENSVNTCSNRYQKTNWMITSAMTVRTFGYLLSRIRLAEIIQNTAISRLETVYSIPLCIIVSLLVFHDK